jgi:hypothetical protein
LENAVPVVLRVGGFKFFFFSDEGNEPVHIHVEYLAIKPQNTGSARSGLLETMV